jgi:hypothetical protein
MQGGQWETRRKEEDLHARRATDSEAAQRRRDPCERSADADITHAPQRAHFRAHRRGVAHSLAKLHALREVRVTVDPDGQPYKRERLHTAHAWRPRRAS